MALPPRVRVLLSAAAIFIPIAALVWYLSAKYTPTPVMPLPQPSPVLSQSPPVAEATPPEVAPASSFTPPPSVSPSPMQTPTPEQAILLPESTSALLLPVAGVRPEDLQDTYNDARGEGRTHDAIDIIAPRGTPVLAAADGTIVKLFLSQPGGITVYQLGTDRKTIYYYAHLERYAEGLAEQQFVRRGQTIAYVGDTGNSGAGNYHLHFSVSLVADPKRYWEGTSINPYPLFKK